MKCHLILPAALLLAGCSVNPVADEEPKHPWEWQPTDTELAHGRNIYLKTCGLCHNEGEQGAPPLGSPARWPPRLAKGTDTLILNAINGFDGEDGYMPPLGDNDTLSEAGVTAAVKFMAAALNQKTH
jgi:cytochrome c5